MTHEGIFRRRHLPHWDVDDKPVFLTACLAGSLSSAGLAKIRARRAQLERRPCPENLTAAEWQAKKEKLIFKLIDDLLDNHSPVAHLSDPRQAHIVRDAFLYFAGQRYQLFAFVVMPSHYHWLFRPLPSWIQQAAFDFKRRTPREVISHSIQSYTANQCNHVRGTAGTYWQNETYDHWVRDEAELFRIIAYIEQNPVRSGLARLPEEYPWSSACLRQQLGIPAGTAITPVG